MCGGFSLRIGSLSLGDDFPEVLRQIQRAKIRTESLLPMVLLVDQFTGRGVTREQMIEMFARSGVPVVFKAEVDAKAAEIRELTSPKRLAAPTD